jgi:hypothetical protein
MISETSPTGSFGVAINCAGERNPTRAPLTGGMIPGIWTFWSYKRLAICAQFVEPGALQQQTFEYITRYVGTRVTHA